MSAYFRSISTFMGLSKSNDAIRDMNRFSSFIIDWNTICFILASRLVLHVPLVSKYVFRLS